MVESPDKTLIIACGALSHEIVHLIRVNNWTHLELTCLPAKIHHTPAKIPDAVRRKIHENRAAYARIFVMFGDCGTAGLLDKMLAEEGVERIEGPHCFSFLAGNTDFEMWTQDEITAFYLSDFFCWNFDRIVWEGLGLDRRDDLAEFVFANYEKVVYMAQTEDPALQVKAREIASRLNLDYEYRYVGYGDMKASMQQIPVTVAISN
jgi:hypothetical protein